MKKPMPPPRFEELLASADKRFVTEIFPKVNGPLVDGRYLHWDEIRHRQPPKGLTHQEWWTGLKFHRIASAKKVSLRDTAGSRFGYCLPDTVLEALHEIDMKAGGQIQMPPQITNQETRDRYYVSSLIEEAITSSQLEGAATTRAVAKEMLRTSRPPRDRSERMILNNFLTMREIGKLKGEALSPDLVLEIHRIITSETLDDPSTVGRLRRKDENIGVWTMDDILLHQPPDAAELPARMHEMCEFANGKTPNGFVHPAVRAIILHFWLAYDHPFCDGNGRTARALFYWCMLRSGFWLFEFITISSILHKAPSKYARSFLHTETDGNDLTYFVVYQLGVICRAIRELHEYIQRKAREVQALEEDLRGAAILNHRQKALISHALRHPRHKYTIESHRTGHGVVYETARADLLDLRDRGLMEASKVGRTWIFTPVEDLHGRLAHLS